MSRKCLALLDSASPRYAEWRAILDADEIPLLEAFPHWGILEGHGQHLIYVLDLTRLQPEQIERLVQSTMKRFHATAEEVRDGILRTGFPVRAADVMVTAQRESRSA
jgi:hypothetical protein